MHNVPISFTEIIETKTYSLPLKEAMQSCPELRRYTRIAGEKYRIDLGDPNALRTYNTCLFRVLEGLEVFMPSEHLIPTCGLRRGITDILMRHVNPKKALEIGTGATAIMALLLAKRGVRVIATDIDPESVNHAKQNIEQNNLASMITVLQSPGGIVSWLREKHVFPVDLVFSLPPYYANQSMFTLPKKGFLGTKAELFTQSSEEEFSVRMIQEVMQLKEPSVIGVLWKDQETLKRGLTQINSFELETKIFQLRSGTRMRYFTLMKMKQENKE